MKRCIAVIMSVILMTSFASCGKKDMQDVYRESYKRLSNMRSYYAEANVVVKNERSENLYHVRQFYKAPDMYSVVVDAPETIGGSGYVFKGNDVLVKSGFGKNELLTVNSPDKRNLSCIVDFIEGYSRDEESTVSVAGGAFGDKATVLKYKVNNGDGKYFIQRLWIDNKTYLPIKLETYDAGGKVMVSVRYGKFILNGDIEDAFFE